MTVVRGLSEILLTSAPREEQHPTKKQLDFVRAKLGEDELDRIIVTNLNRGQVTQIIGDWIRRQPRTQNHSSRWYVEEDEYSDFAYTGDYLDYI